MKLYPTYKEKQKDYSIALGHGVMVRRGYDKPHKKWSAQNESERHSAFYGHSQGIKYPVKSQRRRRGCIDFLNPGNVVETCDPVKLPTLKRDGDGADQKEAA